MVDRIKRNEYRIFISYSHCQTALVRKIQSACEEAGYKTWRDEQQLKEQIDQCLVEGIRNSDAAIICMSKEYQASEYCQREVSFVCKNKKHIKPVIVDSTFIYEPDSFLEFVLKNRLYTNLTLGNFDDEIEKVITEIDGMFEMENQKLIIDCDLLLNIKEESDLVEKLDDLLNNEAKDLEKFKFQDFKYSIPLLQMLSHREKSIADRFATLLVIWSKNNATNNIDCVSQIFLLLFELLKRGGSRSTIKSTLEIINNVLNVENNAEIITLALNLNLYELLGEYIFEYIHSLKVLFALTDCPDARVRLVVEMNVYDFISSLLSNQDTQYILLVSKILNNLTTVAIESCRFEIRSFKTILKRFKEAPPNPELIRNLMEILNCFFESVSSSRMIALDQKLLTHMKPFLLPEVDDNTVFFTLKTLKTLTFYQDVCSSISNLKLIDTLKSIIHISENQCNKTLAIEILSLSNENIREAVKSNVLDVVIRYLSSSHASLKKSAITLFINVVNIDYSIVNTNMWLKFVEQIWPLMASKDINLKRNLLTSISKLVQSPDIAKDLLTKNILNVIDQFHLPNKDMHDSILLCMINISKQKAYKDELLKTGIISKIIKRIEDSNEQILALKLEMCSNCCELLAEFKALFSEHVNIKYFFDILKNESISIEIKNQVLKLLFTIISNNEAGEKSLLNFSDNVYSLLNNCLAHYLLLPTSLELVKALTQSKLGREKAVNYMIIMKTIFNLLHNKDVRKEALVVFSNFAMVKNVLQKLQIHDTLTVLISICIDGYMGNDYELQEYSLKSLAFLSEGLKVLPSFLINAVNFFPLIANCLLSPVTKIRQYSQCIACNLSNHQEAVALMIKLNFVCLLFNSLKLENEPYHIVYIVTTLSSISEKIDGAQLVSDFLNFSTIVPLWHSTLKKEQINLRITNIIVNASTNDFPTSIFEFLDSEFEKDKKLSMNYIQKFSKSKKFVAMLYETEMPDKILNLLEMSDFREGVFQTILNISAFDISDIFMEKLMKKCIGILNPANAKVKVIILKILHNLVEKPKGYEIAVNSDLLKSLADLFSNKNKGVSRFSKVVLKSLIKNEGGRTLALNSNLLVTIQAFFNDSLESVDTDLLEVLKLLVSVDAGRAQAQYLRFPALIDKFLLLPCSAGAKTIAIEIKKLISKYATIKGAIKLPMPYIKKE